ncbi:hypothetical protein ZTR_09711 [Talaromyces verruculosus]|nr:hypothetical protein ZTR_09711 [Talaromyces verruculosus]
MVNPNTETDLSRTESEHNEKVSSLEHPQDDYPVEFSMDEKKKLIRRIDYRLMTSLGGLYCFSLVDRTNLGSASIAGMSKDLRLEIGNRYNIINLVFFVTYVIFQPLAVVLLRRVGPRILLSAISLSFGTVIIGFGFVHNWTVMVGLRIILGALEAGFFPSCAYLLSAWYQRYELQKRYAIFYVIGSSAGAFAGIVAYGLQHMNGLGGLAGWRWIFIVEGIVTCLLAIYGFFFIVDFPELSAKSWRFLKNREATYIVTLIEEDRHDALVEPFKIGNYLRNALDWKIWAFAWVYMLTNTLSYAIAIFLPIILQKRMGFGLAKSQCLVAPPYVAAGIVMYIQGVYADKWRVRGPVIICNACFGLVGLSLLGFASNNSVRYFGVFLATISANANIPAVLAYQANNIRGQWKRALASATLVMFGGLGGIIGSTIFRNVDSPNYHPGIIGTILSQALIIAIVSVLSLQFWRANKAANMGHRVIEGEDNFRYTY